MHHFTKQFLIWQGIDKDTQIEIPSIRELKNEPNLAYPLSKKMIYNIVRNKQCITYIIKENQIKLMKKFHRLIYGLLKSNSSSCEIDGNQGNTGWDCFGQSIVPWNGRIPGPKEKIATSMHLYIWAP